MSPRTDFIVNPISGFPRVSGDEPILSDLGMRRDQFSPRERG